MSASEYERQKLLSVIALEDPQPGDHWHEMYSYHLFVVAIDDSGRVVTMDGSPPITFPTDKGVKRCIRTKEEFKQYLSYGGVPGTWATCYERGSDVAGWEEDFAASRAELTTEGLTK